MDQILLNAFKQTLAYHQPEMSRTDRAIMTRRWNEFYAGFHDFSDFADNSNWIAVRTPRDGAAAVSTGRMSNLSFDFTWSDMRSDANILRAIRRLIATEVPSWARLSNGPTITRPQVRDASDRFANIRQDALTEVIGSTRSNNFGGLALMYKRLIDFKRNTLAHYREAASRLGVNIAGSQLAAESPLRRISRDNSASIEQYLESRKSILTMATEGDLMRIAQPSVSKKASRTWGIEIEHIDTKYVDAPDGWDAKYDGSLEGVSRNNPNSTCRDCKPNDSISARQREFENARSYLRFSGDRMAWQGCSCDGCVGTRARLGNFTVTTEFDNQGRAYVELGETPVFSEYVAPTTWHCDCYTECREFVSPILTVQGSPELAELMESLKDRETNDTAGVHVHVGANDLTVKQTARLVRNYALIEPIITELYQRQTRGYCKSHAPSEVAHSAKVASGRGSQTERLDFDRYMSLNLRSLTQHGTVEFRAMGPVYNYDYLVRWAQFVREFVNVGSMDIPQTTWAGLKTFEDILNLFKKHGSELDFA